MDSDLCVWCVWNLGIQGLCAIIKSMIPAIDSVMTGANEFLIVENLFPNFLK